MGSYAAPSAASALPSEDTHRNPPVKRYSAPYTPPTRRRTAPSPVGWVAIVLACLAFLLGIIGGIQVLSSAG